MKRIRIFVTVLCCCWTISAFSQEVPEDSAGKVAALKKMRMKVAAEAAALRSSWDTLRLLIDSMNTKIANIYSSLDKKKTAGKKAERERRRLEKFLKKTQETLKLYTTGMQEQQLLAERADELVKRLDREIDTITKTSKKE